MVAARPGTRREGRRPPIELHFGYNYSRGRIPRVGAAADHPKLFRIVCIAGIAAALFLVVSTLTGYEGPLVRFLGMIGAVGRGVAVLGGGVGLLAALLYYYSAGIDWPLETAWRLVFIGASIGLSLTLAIIALSSLQGWPLWRSPLALGIAGALAVLAAAGFLGQRGR